MLIAPWRYAPVSDSDGERIGTDHFILDANGDEVGIARNEAEGLATAAAPDLLAAARTLLGRVRKHTDGTARIDADDLAELRAAVEKATPPTY